MLNTKVYKKKFMRYDPNKTSERLKGVPVQDRVFIYNAAIIIEFLNNTLMPTAYFLKPEELHKIGPGQDFKPEHMKDPKDLNEFAFSLGDLYGFYKLYRQQKDYTAPIESRYKFSVILKKLSLHKNGWKFNTKRVGRAQIVYFSPALLRAKVDPEIKKMWPPGQTNILEGQVEVSPKDMSEDRFVEAGAGFEIEEPLIPTPDHPADGF